MCQGFYNRLLIYWQRSNHVVLEDPVVDQIHSYSDSRKSPWGLLAQIKEWNRIRLVRLKQFNEPDGIVLWAGIFNCSQIQGSWIIMNPTQYFFCLHLGDSGPDILPRTENRLGRLRRCIGFFGHGPEGWRFESANNIPQLNIDKYSNKNNCNRSQDL